MRSRFSDDPSYFGSVESVSWLLNSRVTRVYKVQMFKPFDKMLICLSVYT